MRVLRIAEAEHPNPNVMFWCPGCEMHHGIHAGGKGWTWNGDLEKPTFNPSILVRGTHPMTDEEHAAWMADRTKLPTPRPFVCHSFVRDGQIEFLGDCTHKLAGKTVPLPLVD
jgi:hypothetical protein